MLTLFGIVVIAVLVTVASRTEGAKPLALALAGALCVFLGIRATALLTASSLELLPAASLVAAEPAEDEQNTSSPGEKDPAALSETVGKQVATEETVAEKKVTEDEGPEVTEAEEIRELTHGAPEVSEGTDDPGAQEVDELVLPEAGSDVEYITQVSYLTPNRPDWLDTPAAWDGDVFRVAVTAGPHLRIRQCETDLEEGLSTAVSEFVNDFLNNQRASMLIPVDLEEIKHRLVKETFQEKVRTSVADMNQLHARLEFDQAFCNHLDQRWDRVRATSRLLQTGMGAGIVLLLVTTLFSYFRLDTATKGYYTGRLQFTAAAAILALVAASVLLAKWIPWM